MSLQRVSELNTGGEVISKISVDALNGQCVGNNRCIYRFTGTTITGNVSIPNAIPLKAPCAYDIIIRWCARSGTGYLMQFSVNATGQTVPGGPILSPIGNAFLNFASIGPNNITITKNLTNDALDFALSMVITGTITYTLECDVYNVQPF